jgi:hypothetical protein
MARIASGSSAALLSAYVLLQWLSRTRGATPRERRRRMPGDDLVPGAQVSITRAATLPAGPAEVWPWLVQMGWGRAGWYTPRWVDRLLFPANGPSARSIRPELQGLAVGDLVPDGPPEAECAFEVVALEPRHHLVLRSTTHLPLTWRRRGLAGVDWTWAFELFPVAGGRRTRLVFRWRSRTWPRWLTAGAHLVVVPADWVMSRGMLRGLSARVAATDGTKDSRADDSGPAMVATQSERSVR